MIIDVTGYEVIPGRYGKDCSGGNRICLDCCNECDYLLCCTERHSIIRCIACPDEECPRTGKKKGYNKKIIKLADMLAEKFKLKFW